MSVGGGHREPAAANVRCGQCNESSALHWQGWRAHAFYCPSCVRLEAAQPEVGLTIRHREILDAIGIGGASPAELGRHLRAREFVDLDVAGLVVYRAESEPGPFRVLSNDGRRGTWHLTPAGIDAVGALVEPGRI